MLTVTARDERGRATTLQRFGSAIPTVCMRAGGQAVTRNAGGHWPLTRSARHRPPRGQGDGEALERLLAGESDYGVLVRAADVLEPDALLAIAITGAITGYPDLVYTETI